VGVTTIEEGLRNANGTAGALMLLTSISETQPRRLDAFLATLIRTLSRLMKLVPADAQQQEQSRLMMESRQPMGVSRSVMDTGRHCCLVLWDWYWIWFRCC